MAVSGLVSKSMSLSRATTMAAASSTETIKATGDISSVFPSLRPDYKPEPLPNRFQDLKRHIFIKNEKELKVSWERLLQSLEQEVALIKQGGTSVSFTRSLYLRSKL